MLCLGSGTSQTRHGRISIHSTCVANGGSLQEMRLRATGPTHTKPRSFLQPLHVMWERGMMPLYGIGQC